VLRPDYRGNRRCGLGRKMQVGSRSGHDTDFDEENSRKDRKTETIRAFALPRYN